MTLVTVLQKSGVFWVHFTLEKALLAMDSKEAPGFSAEQRDAAQHASQAQLHHP